MQYLKWIAVFILVIIFQAIFVDMISLNGIKPDFILLLLVISSLRLNRLSVIILAFSVGLLQDFLTGGIPGLSSLCKTLTVLAVYNIQQTKRFSLTFYSFIILIFTAITIHETVYFTLFKFGSVITVTDIIFSFILPSMAYSMVMAVFLYLILQKNFIQNTIMYRNR